MYHMVVGAGTNKETMVNVCCSFSHTQYAAVQWLLLSTYPPPLLPFKDSQAESRQPSPKIHPASTPRKKKRHTFGPLDGHAVPPPAEGEGRSLSRFGWKRGETQGRIQQKYPYFQKWFAFLLGFIVWPIFPTNWFFLSSSSSLLPIMGPSHEWWVGRRKRRIGGFDG